MALTSFFTALTGLNSNSHTINVIGDNLANMNTIGFKAGKATFAEIIGGMSGFSATGNPIVFGQGSMLNGVVHKQAQGTPEYTGNSTDAMINGNGYFVVATGDGGIGYTRAGRFQFDSTGNLVSSDGYQLMGYRADDKGKIDQAAGITTLEVRMGQFVPATATTEMAAAVNLDAQVKAFTSAADTPESEFITPIQVFDGLGAQHTIQLRFEKISDPGDANPEWGMTAWMLVDNPDYDPNAAIGTPESEKIKKVEISNLEILDPLAITPTYVAFGGTLLFDGQGKLINTSQIRMTIDDPDVPGTMSGNQIMLNLTDSRGNPMFTSAASASATSTTSQNGFAASNLASVSFNNKGVIIGIAANGNTIELGQLAIATFPNIEGLQKYNGSTLIASMNAGEPSIGTAGSGGRGSINGGSLEMSNVDMAEEFVNLIIAQRAFQANARMITTSDELYQEAIHLKR